MKVEKSLRRERRKRRRDRMIVDSKSVFVIQEEIVKRGKRGKKEKENEK